MEVKHMSWFKKFLIKMAVGQLDQLKPVIEAKVKKAQEKLNSIPPHEFAEQLVNDLEDAILEKAGIPKED
jgi:hypothetical protein